MTEDTATGENVREGRICRASSVILYPLDVPLIDDFTRRAREEVTRWIGCGERAERKLLTEFRVYRWRGAEVYGMAPVVGDDFIGLLAAGYQKRGPYLNVYGLYVLPTYRRLGLLDLALDLVVRRAKELGKTRVKSTASSYASLRLYQKRGWAPNGVTELPYKMEAAL
jgi:GNAT superfamily N-acetyltransferase